MKQVEGVWLPDSDTHFEAALRKGEAVDGVATYQIEKYRAALGRVKHFDLAFDVGGHVGLWSRAMSHDFNQVIAFEPVPELCECFRLNTASLGNVVLEQVALGATSGECRLSSNVANSGHTMIDANGSIAAQMMTLDAFVNHNGIQRIDLLKIDVEGFELQVLQGGEQTIRAMRPLVIIEQKKDNAECHGFNRYAARDLLKSWGARLYWRISGDLCLGWRS